MDFMYCHCMLRFLRETISVLRWNFTRTPECSQEDECRKDLSALVHMLKLALQLLEDHKFVDMRLLQSSEDTQVTADRILKAITVFASKWNVPGAKLLPSVVPTEYCQRDKEQLTKYLAHVLGIESSSFEASPVHVKEEWELAKEQLLERMTCELAVIPKLEITFGNRLGSNVHEASWKGSKVATRQVVPTGEQEMDIEKFAKLYTKAVVQISAETKYVVKVHGVTRSGALVMDLAKCNLQQWYRSSCALVAAKLVMLAQAAQALLSLHNSGIVYVHVKSSNFLIFDQNAEDYEDNPVRLAILSSEDSDLDMAHSTIQTARWMPAELYEGEAPSMKTDVYSFGAVLYELVMEEVPYGRSSTEAEVLRAKQNRQPPFRIPQRVEQLWPGDVLDLMMRCCSHDPDRRPSMREVHECLQEHCPPSQPASQEHIPLVSSAEHPHPRAQGIKWTARQLPADAHLRDEDPLLGHERYHTVRILSSTDHALLVVAADAHRGGKLVAVKLFVRQGDTKVNVKCISTHHPHVSRLREVFSWRGALGVAMELADRGNMRDYMTSCGDCALDEVVARFYFQQLVLAVDYCHRRGFAVGDLKLENLLLSTASDPGATYPVLWISNKLGMAVNVDPEQQKRYGDSTSGKIPDYTAPEKLLGISTNGMLADVWSCGVLLYVMLVGRFAFTGTRFNNVPVLSAVDMQDICTRIQRSEYVIPPSVSGGSADIIRACLAVNPDARITIDDILEHPWFQTGLPQRAVELNIRILIEEAER
eukprot:evm.model.scf_1796.1 EVM.evm.TU.scf_1796.1   scf_1796:7367-10479(+)